MLKGIGGETATFLADLTRIENRISAANKQITSGVRVSQASDDPAAVTTLLRYRNRIDGLTQTQVNLALAKAETSTADGALQTASTILDRLTSIAAQGASDTSTAEVRTILGGEVQQLQQQLVVIANTSLNGRHIFGGDDPGTIPYSFDWTVSDGVVRNSSTASTSLLHDGNGMSISAGMTASQIFDSSSAGVPAPENIFHAVYLLGEALSENDPDGVRAAADLLKSGTAHLSQVAGTYGDKENWISQASSSADSQLLNLQQLLAGIRDTDLPSSITQLISDQSALQAALSAHASLSLKSLFDYFG